MAKSKKKPETENADISEITAAMMVGNPALAKAWTEVMTESARFVSERLQHDIETQKVMMACKTPAEVMQVQSDFFRKAMQDYSEEAQRMYQIMTGAGEDALKRSKTKSKRGYDDVPV
jgi:hypothetical protein